MSHQLTTLRERLHTTTITSTSSSLLCYYLHLLFFIMKFTITTAILGLATTISAIPTPNNLLPREKALPTSIRPKEVSMFNSKDGRIQHNIGEGVLLMKPSEPGIISTLVTFEFPALHKPNLRCELMFELNDPTKYTVKGQAKFIDVFTLLFSAVGNSPGPTPNNGRNQHLGRYKLVPGSHAGKESGNFIFDCPAHGTTKAFEIAPTGGDMLLKWMEPSEGPYIRYFT